MNIVTPEIRAKIGEYVTFTDPNPDLEAHKERARAIQRIEDSMNDMAESMIFNHRYWTDWKGQPRRNPKMKPLIHNGRKWRG